MFNETVAFFQTHFHLFGIVLLSLFIGRSLPAQSSVTDSLENIIANTKDELTRIETINHLANEIVESNPDSALLLIEEILPYIQAIDNPPILINAMYTKGRVYEERRQLDSALIIYEETKELAQKNDDLVNQAHALIQMGAIHSQKNEFAKGFKYLKKALEVADKSEDKQVIVRAANNLGRNYSMASKFDSSTIYLTRALDIQRTLGRKRFVAEILVNIGNNYARDGQKEKAISSYLESQQIMRELNDLPGIAFTYRSIGVTHFFAGNYPAAIEQFLEAYRTVEGTTHHQDVIILLDYLGEAYMTIEDYENAQLYWEKAAKKWQEVNGEKKNPDFSFKMGRVLLSKKEYKSSLNQFLEAEKLKKEAGQFVAGDLYWNTGQAYEMLENYDAAQTYYQKALDASQSADGFFLKIKCLNGLGKVHENKNDLNRALTYYTEAHELAAGASQKEPKIDAASGLFRIYKRQNKTDKALRFLELAKTFQDSLYDEQNTKEVARLEAKFEFEQEKQELAFAQKQELEQQNNIRRLLYIALVLAGLIMLVGFLFIRSKQRANAKLSQLNEELMAQKAVVEKQKEKLEKLDQTKSRFFTNISHEFRTPLTVISGMVDQINDKPEVWLERGSKMIKRNTLALLNLVNQILDLRKLESNELKVQLVQGDVVKYLRYISESYDSFAKTQGIQLHFLPVIKELAMDYDPEKLLRILTNLLSNAVKYTPAGGNIYVHIDKTTNNSQACLSLRVQDTGQGIDEKDLPNIFDRFYQVEDALSRKGDGTGIGLALTRELVKLLGGEIEAQSQLGNGSTFTVELPIYNRAEPGQKVMHNDLEEKAVFQYLAISQPQNEDLITTEPRDGKPRLLVVEDNPDVRQFLTAFLEKHYSISIAEDGQAGIDKAIESIPDLIVSDVMMPEKNGYELTKTLKNDERTDHIPIILLTAKADLDSKISGLEKGADAYLAKPFEEKELLVRLEKLLELRKKLQARYIGHSQKPKEEKVEDPFFQKFYSLVEGHIADPQLDMNKVSRSIGMSRTQVFRKLKAITGKSPTALIRSIRLQKGKELLSADDLTVSEVAYEVGFTSLNYFSTAFFEEFGVRPSSFRK
ncbi:MAG: tetratricopeptide repeat protein [Bacteroidota bacterium]